MLKEQIVKPVFKSVEPPAEEAFLTFGCPLIEEAEIDEVVGTMRSGWLGTGPKVARFEQEFAAYKGWGYPVALNSCTAALHVSLLAAGIGPGDEVITTPMTFCATINAIIHAGAKPVLADIDPHTLNIDPLRVASAITPRTRAVLPVHFAGRACEMDELGQIADQRKLIIIEDCAHAIETQYHGRNAGTFGRFGCFSFYATKNVTTGEGGMVLVERENDAARLKTLALHGLSKDAWQRFGDQGYKHYFVTDAGFKYNMMDLQAAIGLHQLARVEKSWHRRAAIWKQYDQAFADLPVTTPTPPAPDTRHGYHLYTIQIDRIRAGISRDAFLDAMTHRRIGVGVHYMSLPEHPFYQERFGWRPEDYPHAMRYGRATVSLPLSPRLSEEDVQRVIRAVRELVSEPTRQAHTHVA